MRKGVRAAAALVRIPTNLRDAAQQMLGSHHRIGNYVVDHLPPNTVPVHTKRHLSHMINS
jgi:hypothetical protein